MINVLYVADKLSIRGATIHGVTKLFSWWIPRFDKARFNVNLCSLRKKDTGAEYLEGFGIDVICLGRGKFDPRTLLDLMKIIKDKKIHVLHLHGYGSTTFGRIASNISGISCIVHEHMYDKGIPFYQKWVDRFLSWNTPHAIAISQSVKQFLVNYRSIPSENISVIINGVPLQKQTNHRGTEKTWKSKLNIPEGHKVVATVGRLDPIKGLSYFIEAARQVLSKFKDVTFLVVGDGALLPTLRQQCKKMEITENVIFMGYCSDVPSLLCEVDIKVIASLFEGGPITLFEAMAAGCAIVSTNTIGLKDVIKENEIGFLVPPKSPEMISEKVLVLLSDDSLREKMGKQAEKLSCQYDVLNTVRKFESYYESIVGV